MKYFDYNKFDEKAEYYERLQNLMERWEYEIVEFKEAKGQYSTDKIGQYFSAISCEANLKQQQYGWFVLGVSEEGERHVVGTSFKSGDPMLLEQFKYEISKDLTDGITFLNIIELEPIVDGKPLRVLMFQIPAAAVGMPTEWKNHCYARAGQSLTPLTQSKIDQIRVQARLDWSRNTVNGATIDHLDKAAIELARTQYKEKMDRPHIEEEVDAMSDAQFLAKLKLMIDGKVTNAAMVLLGNEDYDYLLPNAPEIMWRLYGSDDDVRDYKIFKIPFISVVDKVFAKVRNLTYRYMPNQISLFPTETQQYDTWLLRELLNNCIAHADYRLGGRIYINEFEDKIEITNPGDFIPRTIEEVLKPAYNPPFHRNQLLAESMVNFHMIDTATSGIKKVFRIQRDKFFPLPDYNLSDSSRVAVTVYGKTLDINYTYILFERPDLDLETVFLLDRIQKGQGSLLSKEAVKQLRKHGLIEGRSGSIYLSADISKTVDKGTDYIRNRGFNDKYYRDMIVSYIKQYGSITKAQIRDLLWDKFPSVLTETQKENKIHNLLTYLKTKKIIKLESKSKRHALWVLGEIVED